MPRNPQDPYPGTGPGEEEPATKPAAPKWVRLVTALTAVAGTLGTGGSVYQWRGTEAERVAIAAERQASVRLLQNVSAMYAGELERAADRDRRCWALIHPEVGEALAHEDPEAAHLADRREVPELEAPAAEPAKLPKVPKASKLERYKWWDDLPPTVQALAPGAPGYMPPPADSQP